LLCPQIGYRQVNARRWIVFEIQGSLIEIVCRRKGVFHQPQVSDLAQAKRNERPAGLGNGLRITGVSSRLHSCNSLLQFRQGWRSRII
jgi:hypothetical protein